MKRKRIAVSEVNAGVIEMAPAPQRQIPASNHAATVATGDKSPAASARPRQLPVILGPIIIVLILAAVWLPRIMNDAAATVNGENISRSELDKRVAFERLWNEWNGQPDPASDAEAERFRAQVLDTMIQTRLALQAAKKAAVSVSAQEIARKVTDLGTPLQLSDAQLNNSLSRAGLARQNLDDVMREDVLSDKYMRLVVLNGVAQAEQQTAIRNWYNTALSRANIEKRIKSGAAQMGKPAPDFALNSLDGAPVRLSDFKGMAVFINFFASWCPDCRAEMPDVEATWRAHKDEGLVLLTVNLTNQDIIGDVTKFVQEFGLTMPVLLDETGNVASLYKVGPIPASYFIDRNGVLKAVQVGGMSRQTMEKRVARVLQ